MRTRVQSLPHYNKTITPAPTAIRAVIITTNPASGNDGGPEPALLAAPEDVAEWAATDAVWLPLPLLAGVTVEL